ncbi:SGNH/GDSL hydrolase family protein [Paenibacillus sp. J2TS4]|uniref:SGNH/GDSL hydrolase family protein n=1 Tax=Paenibacillus sp. J2TS4 TaxID=2807194 RepID=UPI001B26DC3E|nr:SGNH/GDSL hydrolase family protein [Paenibacillus sp. J2TS4]GIP33339.1 hydrolase [Paenibacillus sp. J2TS4]
MAVESQTLFQLLDTNLLIKPLQGEWKWHSPLSAPFKVLGFPWLEKEKVYRRLPLTADHTLPEAVDKLADCTAGGQIRFRTDAPRVAIRVKLRGPASMNHMPATGQIGFDAYVGEPGQERYIGTSRMKPGERQYESMLFEGDKPDQLRTVSINFPLYQGVTEVRVGLPPEAVIEADEFPGSGGRLVFYGTSITQGGCASRPGLAYPQQIGRRLQREVINLGFSGSGKGEAEVAKVIRLIPNVDCFIVDYEANCTTELYGRTLETFLSLYREKQPLVPILVVSKIPYVKELVNGIARQERIARKRIAINLVRKLNQAGDDRVFFFDGNRLLGDRFDECTVDGVHPNDLGFTRIAESLIPVLSQILEHCSYNWIEERERV